MVVFLGCWGLFGFFSVLCVLLLPGVLVFERIVFLSIIDLIVSDLDGTLVVNKDQYNVARAAVVDVLLEAGFSDGDAVRHRAAWDDVDKEFFTAFGVWGKRFGASAVAALDSVFDGHDYDLSSRVFDAACSFREFLCPPVEEMVSVMGLHVDAGTRLVVLTRGDDDVQHVKLDNLADSGLVVDRFVVVPDKNVDVFSSIVEEEGFVPSRCLAVGDSLLKDVIPALSAGFGFGVHISGADTWSPLDDGDASHEHAVVVNSHSDAARFLEGFLVSS